MHHPPHPELLFVTTTAASVASEMERRSGALAALPNAALHECGRPGRLHLTIGWNRSDAFFSGTAIFGSTVYRGSDVPPGGAGGRGCFMLSRSLEDGTVEFRSDPLAMFPVFVYDQGGVVAVSSSAMLLEFGLGQLGIGLARSNRLLAFMITLGSGYDGMTAFEDVRMLAAGETLSIDRSNRPSYQRTHVGEFLYSGDTFETLLDRAAWEIQENIRAVSQLPAERRICDLTGGMDSRLVVAAILHAGLASQFQFNTTGSYPNPDANAAALIRGTFDLNKVSARPPDPSVSLSTFSPLERMRRTVGKMSGIQDMFNDTSVQGFEPREIKLGGGLGELIRKFWSSDWSKIRPKRSPLYRVVNAMKERAHLLRPEMREEQEAAVAAKGFQYLRDGIRPDHVGDAFYLTARCPYHFGAWWSRSKTRFHPLYSIAGLQAAHAIPNEEKKRNRVGYELMRRMSPELVNMPFAEKKWHRALHPSAPEPITRDSPSHAKKEVKQTADAAAPAAAKVRTPAPVPVVARKVDADSRAAEMAARKGVHQRILSLPDVVREFGRSYPRADLSALSDVIDLDAAAGFLASAASGFADSRDTWMTYRLLMGILWANSQEIWSLGAGTEDVRLGILRAAGA